MTQRFPDKLHGKQKDRISKEMYLKTILQLKECKRADPRPVDIAHVLEASKSSVSEMILKLKEEGLVDHESYGRVTLTQKGAQVAQNIMEKFMILREFLSRVLKVDAERVYDEACNLEHAFSDYSIEKLKLFLKEY